MPPDRLVRGYPDGREEDYMNVFLAAAIALKMTMVSSWYGPGFHGRTTANGEKYNQWGLTAAHKTLPFGSVLRVTHNGKSVVVRVNDRGPYIRGRDLDLSMGAAQRLGIVNKGVARIKVEYLYIPPKKGKRGK